MDLKKVGISELVMDFEVYPRTDIDSSTVADLVLAIEAGIILPPIVVDRDSNRVVDGFHRIKAFQNCKLEKIDVHFKDYGNDMDLYLDAVSYNAKHGRKLSRYDQIRIITKAENYNINPSTIANAMNITIERINSLKIKKTARVVNNKITTLIPIKGTLRHLSGQRLSEKQRKGNEKASGMKQSFYINQVINLLENELVDWGDRHTIEGLNKLGELIRIKVKARKAA